MHACITLSLLAGIRTEEARALRWSHVDLDGDPDTRRRAARRRGRLAGHRAGIHQPPGQRALDAGNVRKIFKRICTETGIGDGWTPRELRTTFVSLMSHHGVAIEEIARLVGHASTRTGPQAAQDHTSHPPIPGYPAGEPLPGRWRPRNATARMPASIQPIIYYRRNRSWLAVGRARFPILARSRCASSWAAR